MQHWYVFKIGTRIYSIESINEISKTCCVICDFLLDANDMGILQDRECKCICKDSTFQNCNPQTISNNAHKLCKEHNDLCAIDLSFGGISNLLGHKDFQEVNLLMIILIIIRLLVMTSLLAKMTQVLLEISNLFNQISFTQNQLSILACY